jgi:hypothetical protein
MTDTLRIEGNERIDLSDFEFLVKNNIHDFQRQVMDQLMTDPSGVRKWILSGFEMSNPAGSQLQVDRGRAIFGWRDEGTVKYGALTTEGDVSKIVDLNTFTPGTYGIYVRFEYVPGNFLSRIFWNPSGDGSEYSQSIATRYEANWSVRVESSNPGDEWLKIGEVAQATMAITDQRNFYFEGEIHNTYQSGWSTEGGGIANDRNADRAQYGVGDFQTFSAAVRQCIEDVKGRGLKRWWDKGIGGMNIGFDDDPESGRLAINSEAFQMKFTTGFLSGTNPYIFFDYGTTNAYLGYHVSSGGFALTGNGYLYALNSTGLYEGTDDSTPLGLSTNRWTELHLGRLLYLHADDTVDPKVDIFCDRSATPADQGRWQLDVDVNGVLSLNAVEDDETAQNSFFSATRGASGISHASIFPARLGLGGQHGGSADGIECFQDLHPGSGQTLDLGDATDRWENVYVTTLNASDVGADLIPDTNFSHDLGSGSYYWDNIFGGQIELKNNSTTTRAEIELQDDNSNLDAKKWVIKCADDSGNSCVELSPVTDAGAIQNGIYFYRSGSTQTDIVSYFNIKPDSVGRLLGDATDRWRVYGERVHLNTSTDSGVSGTVTYTGITSGINDVNVSTIKSTSTQDNVGWLKIYDGTTARYIPLFSAT